MLQRKLLGAMAVVSLLCTGACSADPGILAPSTAAIPVYRLAADDKVRIGVYGEDQLTGTFTVGSDGNISFPLLGSVKAAGLTRDDLQAVLTQRLRAGYVVDPKVTVDLSEYRPFYILGEVNRPGQYPYRAGLTVNAAVATAGGFTYRANHRLVAIQRSTATGEQRYRMTSELQILPGDTIRVLERYF